MRRYLKYIPYILLVLTLGFIWVNSMLPGEISTRFSRFVLRLLGFSGRGKGNGLIRKIAHGLEFATLGGEVAVIGHMRKWKYPHVLASGLAACFIDESIQLLIPGRYGCIEDMWIDFPGFVVGSLLAWIVCYIVYKVKMKKEIGQSEGASPADD